MLAMASEMHEDIERLLSSINPKLRDILRDLRLLELEIDVLKEKVDIKSNQHFEEYALKSRYDRIEDNFEIEKIYKEIIEKSLKKIEIVKQTKHLVMKYMNKVDEKLAQFREKMDYDYPNTSVNIEKKIANHINNLLTTYNNTNDAMIKYLEKEKWSQRTITATSTDDIDERCNYNDIIPGFNGNKTINSMSCAQSNGISSHTGCNIPSSSSSTQPPPLTALKHNRGKNIANHSVKGNTSAKQSNKNVTNQNRMNDMRQHMKASTSHNNSINKMSSATVTKSFLNTNKTQRKRKLVNSENLVNKHGTNLEASKSATTLLDPIKSNTVKKSQNIIEGESTSKQLQTSSSVLEINNKSLQLSSAVSNSIISNQLVDKEVNTTNNVSTTIMTQNTTLTDTNKHNNEPTMTAATSSVIINDDYDGKNDQEIFCICKQPSYGEMIGCDSDNCKIGWFHLECVSLLSAPEGEWYCPDCSVFLKTKSTSTNTTAVSATISNDSTNKQTTSQHEPIIEDSVNNIPGDSK